MPLPLIPIITAIAAGGTLVPHAAGGMIVTAATSGGYVAGTYLSTAAIATIISTAAVSVTAGAAVLTGAVSSIVGGAGIFGTTIGASGVTGALMSAGLISSTSVIVPVLAIGTALTAIGGGSYATYRYWSLKRKAEGAKDGQEAQFTEIEAKIVERLLITMRKDDDPKGPASEA